MGVTSGLVQASDGWFAPLLRRWRRAWAADAPCAAPAPPRVLVVDDNPVNLMLASAMLAEHGIQPMLAADGAEAVALALELPVDFILMDLQMPVLDGYEATRQIRRFEREQGHARVPIVAYTACIDIDVQVLQACEFDGVLRKPCDSAELLACLQRGHCTGRA